ncbi:MAG: IS21 family transposase [Clostridiales bacterium]|nr:IS21 family transposase [Clostridiales bacterium]MCF8021294.1 IS21 family transposase [Clostridiales bacterium]
MLAMAQLEYIKFLRNEEGLSINTIAKKMNVNWRTAKKYADRENWNIEVRHRKKTYPVLGPYLDIIDTWLLEDQRRPKKQRHTNIHIYERLVKECGFTGGQRTVTTYVANKKKELTKPTNTYLDLQHPGGEAQVDFGTAEVTHLQKLIQVKYLVMSFPYSNASYLWFLPGENIECFLTGLQELFKCVDAVPRKIWFDNLSAAVAKVQGRDRKTTELFRQFALHYGFQHEFCNVGEGHEKGNVENKVGCTRRNWMVPLPQLTSWESINKQMKEKAEKYLQQKHYEKQQPIGILFEEEKKKMKLLPREPFDVYRLSNAILDKYGKVKWDGQHFSIPRGSRHENVLLKVYWDQVQVLNEQHEQIGSFPRPYTFKEREIDWMAELELIRIKPKAVPYSWVYSQLSKALQTYINISDLSKRKKRISWLIKWFETGYSMENINQAIENTSIYQQDQEGIICHALYQLANPQVSTNTLPENYTPEEVKNYDPDLSAYDQLSKRGVAS